MAKRRMFSLDVCDTDRFLDMPTSSQALYFHLGLRADDDGFVSSPIKITSLAGCCRDDLNLLIAKGYIIPFQSGVCVIADWKVNNYLRSDRYTPTIYAAEKAMLNTANAHAPTVSEFGIPSGIPPVSTGKERIGKESIISADKPQTPAPKGKETDRDKKRTQFAPPTLEDVQAYCTERGNGVDANAFVDYYTANGWRVGRNKMRDWKASVRYWERNSVNSTLTKSKPAQKSTAPQHSCSPDELIEYPPGSGNYIPADRVPKEGNYAV